MKKHALTSILVFFSLSLFAQVNIDSLFAIWNDTKQADTVRLNAVQNLAMKGYRFEYPDSALYYAQLQYDFALKTKHKNFQALALNTQGDYYLLKGNLDKSFAIFNHALKIAEDLSDKRIKIITLGNISRVYESKGDLEKALDCNLQILKISEEIQDKTGIGKSLGDIGANYAVKGDLKSALEYLKLSNKIFEELDDKNNIARVRSLIANIYMQQGDLDEALKLITLNLAYFEDIGNKTLAAGSLSNLAGIYSNQGNSKKALQYLEKSIDYFEDIGNIQYVAGLSQNMGRIYYEEGNIERALEYILKSLKLSKMIKDERTEASAKQKIGIIFTDQGKYNQAITYGNEALVFYQKIGDVIGIRDVSKSLTTSYKASGNYKKAFEMNTLHFQMRDSVNSKENQKAIIELQVQSNYEKKALADSLKFERANFIIKNKYEQDAIQERNERNVILISGIFILLAAVVLWRQLTFVRKTNITIEKEKKEAESQKLKAEQSESFKQQFFANISHEFRTPLTLILGPLDRIISKLKNEEQKQDLNLVKRNARRLQSLINQLLSLSKLDSGEMKLKASPENVVKLTQVFVQSFHSLAENKGIKLEFDSDAEDYTVYIDPLKFEKIANNLLSNSFKFTENGGKIKVSISSSIQEDIKGVVIKFSDTGIGMRKENLQHVFDRFYQVDDEQVIRSLGSGIGLALTKELIELHHGTIRADSEYGMGTTFSVFLPIGKDHLKENEIFESDAIYTEMEDDFLQNDFLLIRDAIVKTEINSEVSGNSDLPLLLIVEDNDEMRSYIRSYLTDSYTVIEATNGKEGAEKAIELVPDLIISDLMMPEMDGNQMIDLLKNDERTSHIPVVLLTAKATLESKLEGLETGADDFLTKPFDASELLVRIRNLINQRKRLSKLLSKHIGDIAKTSLIKESLGKVMSRLDEEFLEKVKNYIDKQMADPDFSVEMLAKQMMMSRVQLHRKLKNLTDHSASDLIRDIRILKAAELLASGEFNVTQVSYEIGISSLSNFAKHFKEKYGVTPSEYMKNLLNC